MANELHDESPDRELRRLPTVAIVGRPNVGKSTLFNRIVGKRKAVVLDTPGVTRDRNFERAEWNGRAFNLIDTGGYETDPRDGIFRQMREQSLLAVEQADLALLVVDVREADNPVDADVAQLLRRSGKPILLLVNKCDGDRHHQEAYSFYQLGFEDLFAISGLNGFGVGDMLDRIVEMLPDAPPDPGPGEKRLRIAVIGRPNVGKSTLVNSLLGEERVIASDLPGTTRDPIDTDFEYQGRPFTLIDTAGLRRRGKIEEGTEKLCSAAAQQGIARSDVALILIDAREGLTQQDEHVAGYAFEEYRCCILVVNKWDLVEKDSNTAGEFVKKIRESMGYLNFAPVVMVSALTGQRVRRVLDLAQQVYETAGRRLDTAELNRWLEATQRRLSPPFRKGRQLRIKYVTQTGSHPPSFTFFVNNPELMHFSYERFLINRLREDFGLEGVPIRIRLRRKSRRRGEDIPA